MRLVVIESPYAGDIDANVRYAQRVMFDSLKRGEAPYASHLLFPGILDDDDPEERIQGINAGFAWGDRAELRAIYVDRGMTKGMKMALERSVAQRQTIVFRSLESTIGTVEVNAESGSHVIQIGEEWTPPDPIEGLQDLLAIVSQFVPKKTLKAWSRKQRDAASNWAAAVHLHASDHDDIEVPPKPDHLKGYEQRPLGFEEGLWPPTADAVDAMGTEPEPTMGADAPAYDEPLTDPSERELTHYLTMGSKETVCGIYDPAAKGVHGTTDLKEVDCPACERKMGRKDP